MRIQKNPNSLTFLFPFVDCWIWSALSFLFCFSFSLFSLSCNATGIWITGNWACDIHRVWNKKKSTWTNNFHHFLLQAQQTWKSTKINAATNYEWDNLLYYFKYGSYVYTSEGISLNSALVERLPKLHFFSNPPINFYLCFQSVLASNNNCNSETNLWFTCL